MRNLEHVLPNVLKAWSGKVGAFVFFLGILSAAEGIIITLQNSTSPWAGNLVGTWWCAPWWPSPDRAGPGK